MDSKIDEDDVGIIKLIVLICFVVAFLAHPIITATVIVWIAIAFLAWNRITTRPLIIETDEPSSV
jgi:hypothetical protein